MDAKTNGALPAHPIPIAGCNDGAVYNSLEQSSGLYGGLTKRELFAAMAMQGMCMMNSPPYQGRDETLDEAFAREAVERADALLAALAQEPTP